MKALLKSIAKCTAGVYVVVTATYLSYMAWQPVSWDMEPGGPEARMVLLLDNKLEVSLGGQVFCAYGVAFKDTGVMGLNLPMTDDGNRLRSCSYERMSGKMFDEEKDVLL